MRGRKPKPSAIKDLLGNPGRRPNKAEPKPPVCVPDCPKDLSVDARKYWDQIGPELARLGVLTALDGAALAVLCDTWAAYLATQKKIEELGTFGLVAKTPTGIPIISGFLLAANSLRKQLREYLCEFGLTPSSRARVKKSSDGAEQPRGGLDLFLSQN